jgi:hypothetical protein
LYLNEIVRNVKKKGNTKGFISVFKGSFCTIKRYNVMLPYRVCAFYVSYKCVGIPYNFETLQMIDYFVLPLKGPFFKKKRDRKLTPPPLTPFFFI